MSISVLIDFDMRFEYRIFEDFFPHYVKFQLSLSKFSFFLKLRRFLKIKYIFLIRYFCTVYSLVTLKCLFFYLLGIRIKKLNYHLSNLSINFCKTRIHPMQGLRATQDRRVLNEVGDMNERGGGKK